MAVLDGDDLLELRSAMARHSAEVSWDKKQFNDAVQSIEDFMLQASTKNAIGNAIETAAPGVFTGQQKQDLFVIWSKTYARRQGFK